MKLNISRTYDVHSYYGERPDTLQIRLNVTRHFKQIVCANEIYADRDFNKMMEEK